MRRILLLLTLAALAGCGGGDEAREPGPRPEPPAGSAGDERVIRGWSAAVNAGRYDTAAGFFATGAVVEQGVELRLATRADAVRFNRSLPCRADVTDVEEGMDSTLAAFDLRQGRGGGCAEGGRARVRFVIRRSKIFEWRQLPEPAAPAGQSAGGGAPPTAARAG